jgi:aspartokinase-like uncharacterized kinase
VNVVVKVGGSLSHGGVLAHLCRELARLAAQHCLLIVPGGGAFADTVREQWRRHTLGDSAAHWMAILGMDQYGYLLADLIPGSVAVRGLEEAKDVALAGRVPVLLPFEMVHSADALPHSWDVTSDSIAAWVAQQAGAEMLVLLKDVDGLYSAHPYHDASAGLLCEISRQQLAGCGGVDGYLSALLGDAGFTLWVVSGEKPERLSELLSGEDTVGTCWRPSAS